MTTASASSKVFSSLTQPMGWTSTVRLGTEARHFWRRREPARNSCWRGGWLGLPAMRTSLCLPSGVAAWEGEGVGGEAGGAGGGGGVGGWSAGGGGGGGDRGGGGTGCVRLVAGGGGGVAVHRGGHGGAVGGVGVARGSGRGGGVDH